MSKRITLIIAAILVFLLSPTRVKAEDIIIDDRGWKIDQDTGYIVGATYEAAQSWTQFDIYIQYTGTIKPDGIVDLYIQNHTTNEIYAIRTQANTNALGVQRLTIECPWALEVSVIPHVDTKVVGVNGHHDETHKLFEGERALFGDIEIYARFNGFVELNIDPYGEIFFEDSGSVWDYADQNKPAKYRVLALFNTWFGEDEPDIVGFDLQLQYEDIKTRETDPRVYMTDALDAELNRTAGTIRETEVYTELMSDPVEILKQYTGLSSWSEYPADARLDGMCIGIACIKDHDDTKRTEVRYSLMVPNNDGTWRLLFDPWASPYTNIQGGELNFYKTSIYFSSGGKGDSAAKSAVIEAMRQYRKQYLLREEIVDVEGQCAFEGAVYIKDEGLKGDTAQRLQKLISDSADIYYYLGVKPESGTALANDTIYVLVNRGDGYLTCIDINSKYTGSQKIENPVTPTLGPTPEITEAPEPTPEVRYEAYYDPYDGELLGYYKYTPTGIEFLTLIEYNELMYGTDQPTPTIAPTTEVPTPTQTLLPTQGTLPTNTPTAEIEPTKAEEPQTTKKPGVLPIILSVLGLLVVGGVAFAIKKK